VYCDTVSFKGEGVSNVTAGDKFTNILLVVSGLAVRSYLSSLQFSPSSSRFPSSTLNPQIARGVWSGFCCVRDKFLEEKCYLTFHEKSSSVS
jgi:hypothetical protein